MHGKYMYIYIYLYTSIYTYVQVYIQKIACVGVDIRKHLQGRYGLQGDGVPQSSSSSDLKALPGKALFGSGGHSHAMGGGASAPQPQVRVPGSI